MTKPCTNQANNLCHCRRNQHGAALMVMLVIMIIGSIAFLVSSLSSSALQIERDKKTLAVLAQAKEALIGYAVSVAATGSKRPGDLPCPDTDNDGIPGDVTYTTCNQQSQRIGRLPWKTLGLPDLRDGSGERLWYAVSVNFKNSSRTVCTNSFLTGCLNSDTPGTITVRSPDGNIINDATSGSGVAAVIIAPGDVLQRQGGSLQDRSSAGINTASNYMDIANGIDNASFTDNTTNGFIQGRIKDNSGNVILNDQLLVITQDNIMQPIQKRVAAEVKNCLTEYAALPQNQGPSPNQGYYPWATYRTVISGFVFYNDSDQLEFGHVPDVPFAQTCIDTGGSNCYLTQSGGMKNQWDSAGTCTLTNSNWWANWKELVFYGFPHNFRPHDLNHNHACSNGPCLVVNPPSAAADKSFVVIVAGKELPGQTRPSNNWSDYLEDGNANGATPFQQSPLSATFNDIVVFK